MKDADEALSSKALASIKEPSRALIRTRQVIRSELDRSLIAALEDTGGELEEVGVKVLDVLK